LKQSLIELARFSKDDATSNTTREWRKNGVGTSIDGHITPFLRHFRVVFAKPRYYWRVTSKVHLNFQSVLYSLTNPVVYKDLKFSHSILSPGADCTKAGELYHAPDSDFFKLSSGRKVAILNGVVLNAYIFQTIHRTETEIASFAFQRYQFQFHPELG
jgi:hypothetical protein